MSQMDRYLLTVRAYPYFLVFKLGLVSPQYGEWFGCKVEKTKVS